MRSARGAGAFTPFGLGAAIRELPQAFTGNAWVARDVACFVLYLGLLVLARRSGVGGAWIVAGAAVIVLPTFSGSFHSLGRFGLLAPRSTGPRCSGRNAVADRAIRWGSATLLVAATFSLPYVSVASALVANAIVCLPTYNERETLEAMVHALEPAQPVGAS